MTDRVEFFVPGRPFSKKRPRFGKGRTWTDPETVAAEEAVRWYARRAFVGREPFGILVGVSVACTFVFKRVRTTRGAAGPWHLQRPDGDNMLKLVLDALNPQAGWHGAWYDDSQVAVMSAEKRWEDIDHPEGTTVVVSLLA